MRERPIERNKRKNIYLHTYEITNKIKTPQLWGFYFVLTIWVINVSVGEIHSFKLIFYYERRKEYQPKNPKWKKDSLKIKI